MGAGCSGFFLLLLVSRRLLLVVCSVDIGERKTLIGQECEVAAADWVLRLEEEELTTACSGTNGLVRPDDWQRLGHVTPTQPADWGTLVT